MRVAATNHASRRKRAKIVPFPLARQRPLIKSLAQRIAAQLPARGEKFLQSELRRRIDALHRRGLSDLAVEREVRAFESAVRAELWRMVLMPPMPDGAA
jgi:hypothetical protein